jgi:hypothetical protein
MAGVTRALRFGPDPAGGRRPFRGPVAVLHFCQARRGSGSPGRCRERTPDRSPCGYPSQVEPPCSSLSGSELAAGIAKRSSSAWACSHEAHRGGQVEEESRNKLSGHGTKAPGPMLAPSVRIGRLCVSLLPYSEDGHAIISLPTESKIIAQGLPSLTPAPLLAGSGRRGGRE